jgi:hypothetical protein
LDAVPAHRTKILFYFSIDTRRGDNTEDVVDEDDAGDDDDDIAVFVIVVDGFNNNTSMDVVELLWGDTVTTTGLSRLFSLSLHISLSSVDSVLRLLSSIRNFMFGRSTSSVDLELDRGVTELFG